MSTRRRRYDTHDLVNRYLAGDSLQTLSKVFRTDRTTIHEVLDEHGIKPRGRAAAARLAVVRSVDATDLIQRYQAGESLHALSKRFGVDRYVVRRVLREGGIEPRSVGEAIRLTRTVHVDQAEVARRYVAGESAHALGIAFGVNERTIRVALQEQGIRTRTMAEANNLALDRLSLAQRQERATRHVVVWEGRSYPSMPTSNPGGLAKKALTQQQTLAQQRPEEARILGMLPVGWVDGLQTAVDRYNVDFTHGSVAVEVHSSGLHPFRTEGTVCRAIDLADRGWHVIFFWPNGGFTRRVTARGIAELVAHAERLDSNPAPERQYLVVRGGGELVTAGRFNVEERTLIPAPVDP